MKNLLPILTLILLFACSAKKQTVKPAVSNETAPAAAAPVIPKTDDVVSAEIAQGKTLYESNCKLCHGLKNPSSRNMEEWNKVVPRMASKVNRKLGREELDAAKQANILKYLETLAKQ